MLTIPLPKGAIDIRLIRRGWGIERCYRLQNGDQTCSPATIEDMNSHSD